MIPSLQFLDLIIRASVRKWTILSKAFHFVVREVVQLMSFKKELKQVYREDLNSRVYKKVPSAYNWVSSET